MGIVNFNFTKINAEKSSALKGKVNISNDISITKVEEHKIGSKKGIKFTCNFAAKYETAGKIELTGEMILVDEEKKVEELLKEWEKSKKLPSEIMSLVMNTALQKSNIEALILSKEINLPPPIQMPKVGPKPEEK